MIYVLIYFGIHAATAMAAAYLAGDTTTDALLGATLLGPFAFFFAVCEKVALAGRRRRELATAKHRAEIAALKAVEREIEE